MANYKTHKNIGIVSSFGLTILISIVLKYIDISILNNQYIKITNDINVITFILMIFFGYIGSLFPDIDLSTSKPVKLFKNIVYFSFVILLLLFFDQLKIFLLSLKNENIQILFNNSNYVNVDLIIILLIFIFPYPLIHLFFKIIKKLTHHRGIIHSIPFAFLLTIILYLSLNTNYLKIIVSKFELNIFLISIMFFIGNIIHFFLDEVYSVDFKNKKIKKSFSTALTIFSFKNFSTYIKIYLIIFVTIYFNFINKNFFINIKYLIIDFINK